MSNKVEEKYIACMVLHAVGDTVGYKNSDWEFMKGSYENINKLYEFIDLGGVNHISLKGWIVSDDTIMHMQTADAILQNFNSMNTFGNILKENFLQALDQFEKEGQAYRQPGLTTMESLNLLKKGENWTDIPYDLYSGGSGASMRSLCFGLAFHGEKNRDKLIQFSIESGRMTNNSAVGYLGGLASALFTALAIEKKPINEWPYILVDLFKSGKVQKYIQTAGRDVDEFERDHHIFLSKWHRYIEDKFDDKKKPIFRKINKNLAYRNKYYMDTFGFKERKREGYKTVVEETSSFIGSGGDDSVIIAYDCLIDAGENWEKLVIYSMLHNGDTDTTGCIAAGLYGALNGFNGVPNNFLEHLQYKKEITDLGKKLFKKFH